MQGAGGLPPAVIRLIVTLIMTTSTEFCSLEIAVITWLRRQYPNSTLSRQIEQARFIRREHTGVGRYVYFDVPRELEPIDLGAFGGNWPIRGPEIRSRDIDCGAGSLCWGADGYVESLELHGYGSHFAECVHDFEIL